MYNKLLIPRFILYGSIENIWLRNVTFDYTSTSGYQARSTGFFIRFTIYPDSCSYTSRHRMLKLKLPFFPLSRPQTILAFPSLHCYCSLCTILAIARINPYLISNYHILVLPLQYSGLSGKHTDRQINVRSRRHYTLNAFNTLQSD